MSWAYALSTSAVAGGTLGFRLSGETYCPVRIRNTVTGDISAELTARGPLWNLDIPGGWPSSLYAAEFGGEDSPAAEATAYFALRPARPGQTSPMLVSVPFLTWQAYNRAGVAQEGLYPTEGPARATRVTFDRPGGGPAGFWERPFYAWLARRGYRAEFCSNLDLHDGTIALDGYRLLVCAGHDEYWTREMRDAAEEFVLRGGNIAFFAANTCWWQARVEDGGRTMVCYRDALSDPLTATDPGRVTVEWSSAPVHRPENTLTGVSFRHGAGCWENFGAMERESYTACFARHWVYEGTGLHDGDTFATGAVGYETDAAEFEILDAVPTATGADGTPGDFVVLAIADLRHWRAYGQGGYATMGVMRRGPGTVFNAATIGWAGALGDPVVDRITRNVLDRLSKPGSGWEPMGRCSGLISLAACQHLLFAVRSDGSVEVRRYRTQNLRWKVLERHEGLTGITAPREAVPGCPVRLYGLFSDGWIRGRDPIPEPASWAELYPAVPGTAAIAPVDEAMYAATADGALWRRPLSARAVATWAHIGSGPRLRALANLNGRLAAVTVDGRIMAKPPGHGDWADLGRAPRLVTLAAVSGRLLGATPEGMVVWRDLTAADMRIDQRRDTCSGSSSALAAR